MHVIDKQRSLKSMSMFCFLAQGMHGELGMVPEARQDPTSHSASQESGYPVPRRVMQDARQSFDTHSNSGPAIKKADRY